MLDFSPQLAYLVYSVNKHLLSTYVPDTELGAKEAETRDSPWSKATQISDEERQEKTRITCSMIAADWYTTVGTGRTKDT